MRYRIENILTGLIVAVLVLVLLVVVARYTGLANVLVAWATLMLALAAFLAIQHSNEQERRRREEERLKEIMEWVDGVLKYCAIYSQDVRYYTNHDFLSAVTELKLKTDYIISIAEEFGKELTEPLGKAVEILSRIFNKLGEKEGREELEEHCIEVKKAIFFLRNK